MIKFPARPAIDGYYLHQLHWWRCRWCGAHARDPHQYASQRHDDSSDDNLQVLRRARYVFLLRLGKCVGLIFPESCRAISVSRYGYHQPIDRWNQIPRSRTNGSRDVLQSFVVVWVSLLDDIDVTGGIDIVEPLGAGIEQQIGGDAAQRNSSNFLARLGVNDQQIGRSPGGHVQSVFGGIQRHWRRSFGIRVVPPRQLAGGTIDHLRGTRAVQVRVNVTASLLNGKVFRTRVELDRGGLISGRIDQKKATRIL